MSAAATMPAAAATRDLNYGEEHGAAVRVEEFKRWLMKFDTDHDGRINRRELREAIRHCGARFAGLRAWHALQRADRNRNGFVDDDEIESLIGMAEKLLGFKTNCRDDLAPVPRIEDARRKHGEPFGHRFVRKH
ncbi:hypothetical protein GUJ93_ZPchr0007g4046 [Zizania palustris]|uniref:EF-hand domain-containing protein n=1 Tax=Zizania palustris TaxID=103762 RepID=A0A8J5W4X0_ZIZPA|nr:hypothetical protein GUJ93_ZPchr0007g4046 [Zizania palustris]